MKKNLTNVFAGWEWPVGPQEEKFLSKLMKGAAKHAVKEVFRTAQFELRDSVKGDIIISLWADDDNLLVEDNINNLMKKLSKEAREYENPAALADAFEKLARLLNREAAKIRKVR